MKNKKKIICIVGPTASGKTSFSIELAEYFSMHGKQSCIINADSRQIYKDFPIITAQPTNEEKKNIPHSLYGILDIEEKCDAGLWLDRVHKEITRCSQADIIPIITGGTGMYIKSLTEGMANLPKIPLELSLSIQQELEEHGTEKMYAKLLAVDKEYAEKIHLNDRQRITRALEVFLFTQKKLSTWHKEAHEDSLYSSMKLGIGMPLAELTPYLYKRTELMLESGALEEAERAYNICNNLDVSGWSGIGCRELGAYISRIRGVVSEENEEYTLSHACELWNKNTRAYAKRQHTWFRADKSIHWCHPLDKERKQELINTAQDFIK